MFSKEFLPGLTLDKTYYKRTEANYCKLSSEYWFCSEGWNRTKQGIGVIFLKEHKKESSAINGYQDNEALQVSGFDTTRNE